MIEKRKKGFKLNISAINDRKSMHKSPSLTVTRGDYAELPDVKSSHKLPVDLETTSSVRSFQKRTGLKSLHNLPSNSFDEAKVVEMLPTLNQEAVHMQAAARFQGKINAFELEDVSVHNSMVDSMLMKDYTSQRYREHRRKLNEQNQQYLRLQIQQKQEDRLFE